MSTICCHTKSGNCGNANRAWCSRHIASNERRSISLSDSYASNSRSDGDRAANIKPPPLLFNILLRNDATNVVDAALAGDADDDEAALIVAFDQTKLMFSFTPPLQRAAWKKCAV